MGGSLYKFMLKNGGQPISFAVAKEYMKMLLVGIKWIHDRDLLHKSIKLSNILMDDRNIETEGVILKYSDIYISRELYGIYININIIEIYKFYIILIKCKYIYICIIEDLHRSSPLAPNIEEKAINRGW